MGPCSEHESSANGAAEYDKRKSSAVVLKVNGRRRYALKMKGPLKEKFEALGADVIHHDPDGRVADLSFEISAAKAVLAQMIEDFDDTRDALKTWHAAYENGDLNAKPPAMISMGDLQRMVLDATRVAALAKTVSDLVPLRTVLSVLYDMGKVIRHAVRDEATQLIIQEQFVEIAEVFRPPTTVPRPGRQNRFQLKEVKLRR